MPGGGAVGGVAPNVKETQADEAPVPLVFVNQTGYLPGRPKLGVVRTDVVTPLPYTVRDGAQQVVFQGQTRPFGKDPASGLTVHRIDFTAYQKEGKSFTLQVETTPPERSHPFDLAKDVYAPLKYDALAFFYHQRSGVPIELPYAGQSQWVRPAGHVNDDAVPCLPGSGCDYELNVKGGWYDAGDHGKYVVNGGVSVWLLQALWERSTIVGAEAAKAFGDGAVNIPERTNGFPDLLDEARIELEFMLRMQVPKGEPLAGMVHHKMHDRAWTALGLPPHLDKQPRFLHKPTTAATLNLAAVAAQASRLWKTLDPKFSGRCLRAAKRAFAAAHAHPAMFAAKQGQGGGPYDDDDVSDERYWAAAELFITTGLDAYLEVVRQRPLHASLFGESPVPASGACFSWQSTAALGAFSLAMTSSPLPESDREALRAQVQKTADEILHVIEEQAFASPLRPGPKGYVWGSNGDALSNLVAVTLAYDFTKGSHYADAVSTAIGYLLGRNPLDKSYVAGYGERPLRNPHHRFWAQQLSSRYPPPPPGAVSGGPNSELQDPVARRAGLRGCAPQACYVDHSGAYSVNEVAINWNAPLVWVAAFLDELR
ncbi:MAG: glycoside hydrolase family 9 protein [Deltaproteobacteria bacterium]|nr:glycoside hydrolase family 9 protein [Deltaproteobacteria bacterium]